MTIWQAIRAIRRAQGMSQRELSELSGRDQGYISRLESGKVNAEVGTLASIAAAVDSELMIVPKRLVPRVTAIITEAVAGTVPSAPVTRTVFDDMFIPDPADDEDAEHDEGFKL